VAHFLLKKGNELEKVASFIAIHLTEQTLDSGVSFWAICQQMAFAAAPKSCTSLFSVIESGRYRRIYYNYLKRFGNKPPRFISITDKDGNKSTQPTPDYLANYFSPQKQLNIESMGFLGDIYDLETDLNTGKVNLQILPWRLQEVRSATEDFLKKAPERMSQQERDLLDSSIRIRSLTEDTVLVTASFVSFKFLSGISQAILHRFQRIGMSCVTFVYRKSGLESNDPITGFTMADEAIEIIKKRRGFSFHLLYDKSVWEMQERLLAARIQQYQNAQTDSEREFVIRMTNHNREPFLPFSGIVTTEWVVPDHQPVELKRYFSNELEDPLNFTQPSKKNTFKLRHNMLFKVIEELPFQTIVEVHAHTILHKKAYLRLGFKELRVETNSFYPGATISVLRGQREEILSTLSILLNRNE